MNLDGYQRFIDDNKTSLYLDHFIGGFWILLVGLMISVVIFVTERCHSRKAGKKWTQCADSEPVAEKASDSNIDLFDSDNNDVLVKVYRFARVVFPLEKFYPQLKFHDLVVNRFSSVGGYVYNFGAL